VSAGLSFEVHWPDQNADRVARVCAMVCFLFILLYVCETDAPYRLDGHTHSLHAMCATGQQRSTSSSILLINAHTIIGTKKVSNVLVQLSQRETGILTVPVRRTRTRTMGRSKPEFNWYVL
jgi:hypothetical protein